MSSSSSSRISSSFCGFKIAVRCDGLSVLMKTTVRLNLFMGIERILIAASWALTSLLFKKTEPFLDSKHLVREVATGAVAGGQEIAITVASQGIGIMSVRSDSGIRLGGLHHRKVDSPSCLWKEHQPTHHPLAVRLRETYSSCHRGPSGCSYTSEWA